MVFLIFACTGVCSAATYTIRDKETGVTLRVEGPEPPSYEVRKEIFERYYAEQREKKAGSIFERLKGFSPFGEITFENYNACIEDFYLSTNSVRETIVNTCAILFADKASADAKALASCVRNQATGVDWQKNRQAFTLCAKKYKSSELQAYIALLNESQISEAAWIAQKRADEREDEAYWRHQEYLERLDRALILPPELLP